MPLKLDALELADEPATGRSPPAPPIIIVIRRTADLFAANTDVGAIAPLLERDRRAPRLASALLGNGGAARAVLVALAQDRHRRGRILPRHAAATKLAVEFGLRATARTA